MVERGALRNIRRRFKFRSAGRLLLWPIVLSSFAIHEARAEFKVSGDPPVSFGVRGGVHVGLHPAAFDARAEGGPRGLLRIAVEHDGQPHLLNYIAVEPIVGGRRGYSELEKSADGKPGKRLILTRVPGSNRTAEKNDRLYSIEQTALGRALRFSFEVERFRNGARPRVEVTLFERLPEVVRFRTFAMSDSKLMESLVLTATMGNQLRCRDLWLSETSVSSRELFHDFSANGFASCDAFPLSTMHRTRDGDIVAVITPDEYEPRETIPRADRAWHSSLPWLGQYWLKRAGCKTRKLRVLINGRRVYWGGDLSIPGGPSIENFEFNEPFKSGQETWFGITFEDPATRFGFPYRAPHAPLVREVPAKERVSRLEVGRASRAFQNGRFEDGWTGWQRSGGAEAFRLFDQGDGKRLTTYGPDREANMGRVWQCFQVPRDAEVMRLFIHGGDDGALLRVALWRGERLYRWMTGRDDNEPFEVRWDLRPVRGEVITVEVQDHAVGPWGFIGIHGIEVIRSTATRP